MKEDWYKLNGNAIYDGIGIYIVNIELLLKATSIEDACARARQFLKPVAELDPVKCEWCVDKNDN